MAITKEDVEYVARLARLVLSEEEKEVLTGQLSKTLDYIDQLNQLNTEEVEPTSHPMLPTPNYREDEVRPSHLGEDLLKGGPKREDGFFVVPRVIP